MYQNFIKTPILTLFLVFLFTGRSPYAEELSFLNNKSRGELSDKKFVDLKNRISSYLSNTWISQEKISLLMDLILMQKPDLCVEIGVFEGASFLPVAAMLKHLKRGKIYAIDPWSNDDATRNLSNSDVNKKWWQKLDMKAIYKTFTSTVDRWKLKHYTKVLRKTSESAAHEIPSIDFLHLDGNYSKVNSLQDVQLYLPKVKKGGYILYSNLFFCAENEHPKKEAFLLIFADCEPIAEVDQGNSVLFRKLHN